MYDGALSPAHTLAALFAAVAACGRCAPPARLVAIGPRVVSNQASYPIMLTGEGLPEGARLCVAGLQLPTARLDSGHLTALLPKVALPAAAEEQSFAVTLVKADGSAIAGQSSLTIVNDAGFPTPAGLALSPDGALALAVSAPTGELWVWHLKDAAPPERLRVGDGPRAVAALRLDGRALALVAHDFADELRTIDLADLHAPAGSIALRGGALAIAVDEPRGLAYLANHRCNCVQVVDLRARRLLRELPAGVRPRALSLSADGKLLAVGNGGSDDVSLFDLEGRAGERRVQPRRGTPIVGGHNESMAALVMGGKAPRALAWSDKLQRLFVASAGLNVGPNPQRSEVTTNGGVGVIDAKSGRFLRHVSLLAGIPSALALDEPRGLLYAADLSRGLLTTVDAAKAAESDQAARHSILASLPLPIPKDAELMRPAADFGVEKRAGLEVHAGPAALALAEGGRALYLLSRFHGTLIEVELNNPTQPRVRRVLAGPPMGEQKRRRRGEQLFYTDVGRSTMSCEACHPDGHDDGVFYAKDHPQRIYRSPSLRGARETPPYFFPAGFPSLELTSAVVLRRNRFSNPLPTPVEIEALTAYQRTIISLPNPNVGPSGALPQELGLPDGRKGDPRRGLSLFEGKAGCSSIECHPGPQFTADQDPATRGATHDVGTPVALPLRPQLQEAPPGPRATPSLLGIWDEFPLLQSGAGGLDVDPDGTVVPRYPFALRRVLEMPGSEQHGGANRLSAAERDDLLAYLMTL